MTRNRLLRALPPGELHRLTPLLRRVTVAHQQVIHEAGAPIDHVYFPIGGVFSVTTALPEGVSIEAATVGDEGMIGFEAFFTDSPVAAGQTLLQVPDGAAFRLKVDTFRRHVASHRAFSETVGRYIQLAFAQIIQAAACNARHPVLERCAKWLLLTHDRMHVDQFRLSHDVLAMMLATTRPTVTLAAGALQRAGLIAYRYGRVTITDRDGLEGAACACYGVVRAQFDSLL